MHLTCNLLMWTLSGHLPANPDPAWVAQHNSGIHIDQPRQESNHIPLDCALCCVDAAYTESLLLWLQLIDFGIKTPTDANRNKIYRKPRNIAKYKQTDTGTLNLLPYANSDGWKQQS